MDLSINYNPTADEIKVIDSLLLAEPSWHDTWEVAKRDQSRTSGCIFILLYDGKPIGFRSQFYDDRIVHFWACWIDIPYRRKGLGVQYLHMVLEHFSMEGYVAVVAEPVTPDGEGLSRKAGFVTRQTLMNKSDVRYRYLPLSPYALPKIESMLHDNYLKIWDRYGTNKTPFYISLDRDFTKHPIVCDILGNCEVEFCIDGQTRKERCVKYLDTKFGFTLLNDSTGGFIVLDKPIKLHS